MRRIWSRRLSIKTVDLKSDMPSVSEAVQRLDREVVLARRAKTPLLKVIHGYGSKGVGGEIRIAAQKRLIELVDAGEIRACIFGENWSKSDEASWKLLNERPELKHDPHLGQRNLGITIVVL